MSDFGAPMPPNAEPTFNRTRQDFGRDAVSSLSGVQSVLTSLKPGYDALNRIPPEHLAIVMAQLDILIAATTLHYIQG